MTWVLFLIQPFFTLLYHLKNFRLPQSKNVMWAFTVFYALTIAVQEGSKADIVRYMAVVELLHQQSFTFQSAIDFYLESGEFDVLRIFLSILISRFTDNGYILMIVIGFIFGYFFSRNIWFVLNRMQGPLKKISLLLIVCLFLVMPIWQINGYRFNTATHVFIYGLLPFLYSGNKRSLVWCLVTPFIFHFSFLFPLAVLCIYLVFGNRTVIYYGLFITSIFFNTIDIQQFNLLFDNYAPQILIDETAGYRLEEKVIGRQNQALLSGNRNWYAELYGDALRWSVTLLLIVLFFKSKNLQKLDTNYLKVLNFTYLFYGLSMFMSSLPSGGRFLAPSNILALSVLAIYLQNNPAGYTLKRLTMLTSPLLILFIIVSSRVGFYQTSVGTILGNPFIAIWAIGNNISLNEILKSIPL